MKQQIRRGVFETNSSSTHTLVLCKPDEYEDFKNGKLYFDVDCERLVTKEEILKEHCIKEDDLNEYIYNYNNEYDEDDTSRYAGEPYIKYSNFYDSYQLWGVDYAYFEEEKDGLVAFGYYGYDG